ncbi:LysR family transcriptional regulator substrate-binding protein [Tyzzerella sp. OttesenSCG-928-J15]|nr:LysR family transcriptional regulator substrate-binding protein [Tyzzerella sp. OttesenSCG-928-J15]
MLTYAGEVYVEKAKKILITKEELDHELKDIIKSNVGILKVAFPVMRGTYMLSCTLPVFYDNYPNMKLDIVEADSDLLEAMILNGETDLAFFNLPIRNANIDYEVIKHEEILLVLSQNHPLAEMGQMREGYQYLWMNLNLIKDEKIILQTKSQRTRRIIDDLFSAYNIEPNIALVTRNISASAMLAARGYGACFVCETHLKHITFDKKPLFFSVGKNKTTVDFVAAFRKNTYLPFHAKEYIKIVKDFT